jgi:TonB family protein
MTSTPPILRAVVGLYALAAITAQASSAVAVAINPNGGLGYGYSHSPNVTEVEIRKRAIQQCSDWAGRDARIIASTAKTGYGAIVMFRGADNKANYTASLAATTQQQATSDALRKANAAGGHNAEVIDTWRDGSAFPGTKAIVIYAPKPKYPESLKKRGIGGQGEFVMHVETKTGLVTSVDVLKSTGVRVLDESCVHAFREWRFERNKCAPVVRCPVRFVPRTHNPELPPV